MLLVRYSIIRIIYVLLYKNESMLSWTTLVIYSYFDNYRGAFRTAVDSYCIQHGSVVDTFLADNWSVWCHLMHAAEGSSHNLYFLINKYI